MVVLYTATTTPDSVVVSVGVWKWEPPFQASIDMRVHRAVTDPFRCRLMS